MITKAFLNPQSIAIIGGSEDTHKPGGRVLKNLIKQITKVVYMVNPKADNFKAYPVTIVEDLPAVDVVALAIPAGLCLHAGWCYVQSNQKVSLFSAGFYRKPQGACWKKKSVCGRYVRRHFIGPTVGFMNENYTGVFTSPIPDFVPVSIDLISGSGATAIFIIDAAIQLGIPFAHVFSVGNSAQIGVEEALAHLDESYVHGKSAPVKLLYAETIKNPDKLYKHAVSLYHKGARIACIKAGSSEEGSRAASSHTGALASPDTAVNALFEKAGIIRCNGRTQLLTAACILLRGIPEGRNMCIETHAGGPAVMLTDVLSKGGVNIPALEEDKQKQLLKELYPGSSAANPIDFLATGTAQQLGKIIDFIEQECPQMHGIPVIFGSPGLAPVFDVYDLLHEKMSTCPVPIYPIFPSTLNVQAEIEAFRKKGRIYFPDEVIFGDALVQILNTPAPAQQEQDVPVVDKKAIRQIVDNAKKGYLPPDQVAALLDAAGIPRTKEIVVAEEGELEKAAGVVGYPLVMKVVGPVHKSDVGGVKLNITDNHMLLKWYRNMMQIPDSTAVLLQSQLSGRELFIGAKREPGFGHTIVCGLGGIFVEVLKDISTGLAPLSREEARRMVRNLRGYGLIQGVRGQDGVHEDLFIEAVCRIAALCHNAPEIAELDVNPLLGTPQQVVAVDARIRIADLDETLD